MTLRVGRSAEAASPPAMAASALRFAYLVLGLLSLGLGLLGALLPVVPTVPFVLLAAFFLSRSSPALHRRLREHRLFGPALRRWEDGGRISRPTKWTATAFLTVALVLQATVGGLPPWGLALSFVVVGSVLAFLWSRPEDPPQP